MIKNPTCFKNPDKPSCIDLILTNIPKSLSKSQTLETGLLDFHNLTLTVLEIHYKNQKLLVATFRDYKNFSNESFRQDILSAMERYSNISFADFHSEFLFLLGKQAPDKKRYIRANQKMSMDKELKIKQSGLGLSFVIKTEENRLSNASVV